MTVHNILSQRVLLKGGLDWKTEWKTEWKMEEKHFVFQSSPPFNNILSQILHHLKKSTHQHFFQMDNMP